ncbi:hypothetical protein [Rhodopseudomonas faecalis]|uniref:hypothetical protein n=1 Tax=Rhodopseudomonas faecalis TaxID=99655 RepID=UPI001FDF75D5|nr:hypothetical protein [Rhodopseudomonas faecalis]
MNAILQFADRASAIVQLAMDTLGGVPHPEQRAKHQDTKDAKHTDRVDFVG